MRKLISAIVTVVLFGVTGFVVWAAMTSHVSYVVTSGVSMLPIYHTGDFVVVVRQDAYADGDIVAYEQGTVTVLHRVIDGDPSGWVTKGDSNESIDPGRPPSANLMGRAVWHVPGGGKWLTRMTNPSNLAGIAFLMVIGVGATVRRRRRRRPHSMGRHADPAGRSATGAAFAAFPSPLTLTAAGVVVAIGVAGAGLGALAFTRSETRSISVPPAPPARTMTFSYATTVPRTPAYDATTITSPEPVFRSVARYVDVTLNYRGPPGTVAVTARLSVADGWHSTVQLVPGRSFTGRSYQTVVRLNLGALEDRAETGAKAAGLASGAVAIAIVPRIESTGGEPFVPALNLTLTPTMLTLGDGPLVVQDAASAATRKTVPQSLRLFGRELVSVSAARPISAALLLVALLAACGLVLLAGRARPVSEVEVIRRRYRQLLVEVAPIEPPPDRPVVRVTEFKTLARLAERYGLLILHWSTPASATFVVPDESVTYWFCTDPASTGPVELSSTGATPAERSVPAAGQAGQRDQVGPMGQEQAGQERQEQAGQERQEQAAEPTEAPYHWQLALPGAQDPLTSLATRSLFEEEAQLAIDGSVDEPPCLMLIDLDGFDVVDAEQGRDAGDAVLVAVAERLRVSVRPRDLVARLDGIVFAVLLENVGTADVTKLAKRMARTVSEPIIVRGEPVLMEPNVGVARARPGDDATILMDHATAALADAKAASGGPLIWYADAGTAASADAAANADAGTAANADAGADSQAAERDSVG